MDYKYFKFTHPGKYSVDIANALKEAYSDVVIGYTKDNDANRFEGYIIFKIPSILPDKYFKLYRDAQYYNITIGDYNAGDTNLKNQVRICGDFDYGHSGIYDITDLYLLCTSKSFHVTFAGLNNPIMMGICWGTDKKLYGYSFIYKKQGDKTFANETWKKGFAIHCITDGANDELYCNPLGNLSANNSLNNDDGKLVLYKIQLLDSNCLPLKTADGDNIYFDGMYATIANLEETLFKDRGLVTKGCNMMNSIYWVNRSFYIKLDD